MLPRSHVKFQCHAREDLEPGNYNVKLYDRVHGGSLPHGSADFKALNKAGAWLLTQVRIIPLEQVLLVPRRRQRLHFSLEGWVSKAHPRVVAHCRLVQRPDWSAYGDDARG